MDNPTFQKIRDLISQNNIIGIAVGQNPSLDTMAGALSLFLGLEKTGKTATIALASEPLVEISNLVGINKVKTNLDGTEGDLIVSFPYKEGEIEKVSYTLEDGFLNIVVKAGQAGLNFQQDQIKYKRGGGFPKLLFIIGTPRLSDLGKLFNAEGLKDTTVVNIDNKSDNQGFGDVVLVSPQFSSVSEQITSLMSALPLDIDIDVAQNLLSGIAFATENFQSPKATSVAFEMAALLMKKGAQRKEQQIKQLTDFDSFFAPKSDIQAQKKPLGASLGAIEEVEREKKKEAPPDWLTPKIYKGSTIL